MGLNRLEDGEEEEQNGVAADGYLPQDAWHGLARRAECCFRTAPTFHYMWATRRLTDQPWSKLKGKWVKRPLGHKVYVLSRLHEYIYFIRMGSFYAEPPPPKQRVERQRKAPSKEAKRIMPTQVGKHKLGQLHSFTCTYTPVLLWELSES